MDSQWIVPFISPSWWFGTFGLFFHSVGNFMIPTEKLIFFRGVAQPPTSISTTTVVCFMDME